MGNSGSAPARPNRKIKYISDSECPAVLVTYCPEKNDSSFKYSGRHFAYTNSLSKLEDIPPPSPPLDEPEIDDITLSESLRSMNKFDVSDAVARLTNSRHSETAKVRALWHWLTSQNIHGTIYRLTEDFNEVEYQLKKLKNGATNDGNTFAALFALLCAYAKITCVVIRGFVKGSLYKIGKPLTNDQLAEWNAVFVDGSWRLLDPFWGACSQNPEGDITSDTADWFLFTEPSQFLYSHFPETPQWQLVEQPITRQEFECQPYLKERFFILGMQDSVIPATSTIESTNGEINLLLPLDSARAQLQEFKCFIKQTGADNKWKEIKADNQRNKFDFLYYMKDNEVTTLSIYVRFPKQGTYKLEVVGSERTDTESELHELDWVAIYRVEVKHIPDKLVMFPRKENIGWGPGDKLREIGIEAISHQEGLIKFYPDDELLFEFRILEGFARQKIRLRERIRQKDGVLQPEPRTVDEDDWYSKDTDGSIFLRVILKVSADYMVQICAEVNGKDIGSVCNYLIVCVGEIVDKVLEEVKQLIPRLEDAMDRCNGFELRRLTDLIKTKALHRHPNMISSYTKAISMLETLKKREDIMRKLKKLKISDVITEIKRYNQIQDERVERIMKATLILLGANEKELKTWDKIRQQIVSTDVTESLPNRIQKLQDGMSAFIEDKRNKPAVRKADKLLSDITPEDMKKVSLVVYRLLEVIVLIVTEYKHANPTMLGRQFTVVEDDISPNLGAVEGTNGAPVDESPSGALQTDAGAASPDITTNIVTADDTNERSTDEVDKLQTVVEMESPGMPSFTADRNSVNSTSQFEMTSISLSPLSDKQTDIPPLSPRIDL